MDTKALLDQLLGAAKTMASKGQDFAEDKLGVPESGPERDTMLNGMGKGALAAGALAILLGTGAGRRLTGTAIKLGGLAAVGGLAYKAYQNWQAGGNPLTQDAGTPVSELSGGEANARSENLLRAMISAAKADGHIDEQEQRSIHQQVARLGLDSSAARLIDEEIDRPLDANRIAALADSPMAAAEIYLASRLVIDMDNAMEHDYMNQLATALKLDAGMVGQLEAQVNAA